MMQVVTRPAMHPVFFRDQVEGESVNQMYGVFRRFDRLFSWDSLTRYPYLDEERSAFDPLQLSPRVRYLLHHLLLLKHSRSGDRTRFHELLKRYPLLRSLRDMEPITEPIRLTTDDPPYAWSYLTSMGIYM